MRKIFSGEKKQKNKIKISRDMNYPKTSWLLRVRKPHGAAWMGHGACRIEHGLERPGAEGGCSSEPGERAYRNARAQDSANFFWKGAQTKDFRLCRHRVSLPIANSITMPWSSHRGYVYTHVYMALLGANMPSTYMTLTCTFHTVSMHYRSFSLFFQPFENVKTVLSCSPKTGDEGPDLAWSP